MGRVTANAAVLADRFFELSLLGLVTSGFLALVGSGYLAPPVVLFTAAGLLLRALMITGVARFELPGWAVAAATIVCLVLYPLDYAFLSRDFLNATVHLVCFLAVIKILTAKTGRDYLYVKVIAFLQLMAAAILSTGPSFFFFLTLFLLFGVATLTSWEVRRAARFPSVTARGGLRRFHVRLGALSLAAAIGILSLTAGLFFLLPRTAHAAFERLVSQRYRLPGFSNEIKLGQMGEILQQNTPVMHVRIHDVERPLALKWRGAVLSHFDGERWFNSVTGGRPLRVDEGRVILAGDEQRWRSGERITYEVHLKANTSDVLFFAGVPEVLWINSPLVIRAQGDAYRLGYGRSAGLRYAGLSYLGESDSSEDYTLWDPRDEPANAYLQPGPVDPRISRLARDVTAGLPSMEARARAIENYLRTNYEYTLELLPQEVPDPLAHFLFERRKGHCEYYASAMAVMLRTLDIPSRLVTGFQSGVLNPVSGWYLMRASDAHSWVEAWLPGRGWTTFDPTPPAVLAGGPSVWARLNFYLDAAEMFWQDWVLNYNLERQRSLASRMERSSRGFGSRWMDRVRLAGARWKAWAGEGFEHYGLPLLALLGLSGAAWLYGPRSWQWWINRRRLHRLLRGQPEAGDAALLYARMLVLLGQRGFQKPSWLTPSEFVRALPPSETALLAEQLTHAYYELRFGGKQDAAPLMTSLLDQLERQP